MILPAHHLGRHISGRSTSVAAILRLQLSRYPQVSDAQVPLRVQDQVLWLYVPVDHFVLMKKLESDEDVSDEEFGLPLVEVASIPEVVPEVPAVEVVHNEVEMLSVLEGAAHVDHEGVTEFGKEFLLVHDGCD